MNRPSFVTWLIGNPVSLIALWAFTAFLAYAWYAWQAPVLFPIVVGVIALAAINASEHLGEYRQWKREWNSMGGDGPSLARALARSRAVRFVVGAAVWCAMAYGALVAGRQPETQFAAWLFWLGTLGLIAVSLYRLIRRRRAKPKPQEIRDVPVTQCLTVALRSPELRDAYAALPEYCSTLFRSMSSHTSGLGN